MNRSPYFKVMLFDSFSPDFWLISCPTFSSVCSEMSQKPEKKSVKNHKIYMSGIGS